MHSPQNKNLQNSQKQKIVFGAGLTKKMVLEIQKTDVLEIADRLAQKGVPTDFKGNKILAWGSDKTVDIFQQLNNKFGLRIALPKGIYAEDFSSLNVDNPNLYGFCNLAPTKLKKGSDEIVPSRTIFFNTLHNWNKIDLIADKLYANKHLGTDFFLEIPFHEFFHVVHENHLLDLYDGEILLEKLQLVENPEQIAEYQKKYGPQVSKICHCAETSPLDAIACDLSRQIVNSIDKNNLTPNKNPFARIPYQEEDLSLFQKMQTKINPLKGTLRNFWNGKFE